MSTPPARERPARRARRERPGLASTLVGAGLLVVLGFALGVVAGLVLEEPDLVLDYLAGRTTSVEVAAPAGDVAAAPPAAGAEAEGGREDRAAGPGAEGLAERGGSEAAGRGAAHGAGGEGLVAGLAAAEGAAGAEPGEIEPREGLRVGRAGERAGGEAAPREAGLGAEPGHAGSERPAGAGAEPVAPDVASAPPAGGFAVQVGAFTEAAIAERLASRLRGEGFPVYVTSSGSNWRVRVGPLGTREEAQRMAHRLERERLPTWVLAEGGP
jgi:DedD protein